MAGVYHLLFSGLLIHVYYQGLLVEGLPVQEAKEIQLPRHVREADNLKEELQKLRRILEETHRKKSLTSTTTSTTTTASPVDQEYNKLIQLLRTSDRETLMDLAKSLHEVNTHDDDVKQEHKQDDNPVGDYLGSNGIVNDENKQQRLNKEDLTKILHERINSKESKHEHSEQMKGKLEINEEEYDSFRKEILHALEKRLLKDVSLALKYGFNPKDIIEDLQHKGNLNKSPRSVRMNLEDELPQIVKENHQTNRNLHMK